MVKRADWVNELLADKKDHVEYEVEGLLLEATERILAEFRKQGMTLTQAAEEIGLSESSVSRSLSGAHNMTLRTLGKLAFAAGCRVNARLEPLDNAGGIWATSFSSSRRLSCITGGNTVKEVIYERQNCVAESESPSRDTSSNGLAA